MTQTPSGMRAMDQAAARKATLGREALFPFDHETHFGRAALGADQLGALPYPGLERVLLAPPLFTPLRYERMVELGREPLHLDVDTRVRFGGFVAAMPVVVPALGSTALANRHGVQIAQAAGRAGVVLTIGENVATMRGYARPLAEDEPCLRDRMLAYLQACSEGEGGLLVQQSVEDADAELWNRIYSDPDFTPYLDAGMLGFEIKTGQGAKPGLGGETRVDREEAIRLADRFSFPDDPRRTDLPFYDRHAAPGTYTEEILRNQIRLLKNNYPKAPIWVKTAGYRDLQSVFRVVEDAGAEAITVDGHAGGTGMAPLLALRHLGLPTVACLAHVAAARRAGSALSYIVAGGLADGADAVKARAVGADGIALGRAVLSAAVAGGETGVARFLAVLKEEVQLMASALGKYHLEDLGPEDLVVTDRDLGDALGVPFAFALPRLPGRERVEETAATARRAAEGAA